MQPSKNPGHSVKRQRSALFQPTFTQQETFRRLAALTTSTTIIVFLAHARTSFTALEVVSAATAAFFDGNHEERLRHADLLLTPALLLLRREKP